MGRPDAPLRAGLPPYLPAINATLPHGEILDEIEWTSIYFTDPDGNLINAGKRHEQRPFPRLQPGRPGQSNCLSHRRLHHLHRRRVAATKRSPLPGGMMPPAAHPRNGLRHLRSRQRGCRRGRREDDPAGFPWFELQHAAAERMAFELAAQPDERGVPSPTMRRTAFPSRRWTPCTAFVQVAAARFRTRFGVRPDMQVRKKSGTRTSGTEYQGLRIRHLYPFRTCLPRSLSRYSETAAGRSASFGIRRSIMGSSERRHRSTVSAVRVRVGSTRPFRTVGWRSPSRIPHAFARGGSSGCFPPFPWA